MKVICESNREIAETPLINEIGVMPVLDIEECSDSESYLKSKQALASGRSLIFLGKDHLSSKKPIKAFAESFSNPGVVIFDAHPDAEDENDLVQFLASSGLVQPKNILLVGTRSWTKQDLNFLQERRIKRYSMKEITMEGISEVCDVVMSVAKDFGALYISIDLDCADPSCAPAVDAPAAGGFSARELVYFIQRLRLLKNFKAADIMGLLQKKDQSRITLHLARKLLSELC